MVLASQGAQSRLYIEPDVAPHTFDVSSESYEFLSEGLAKQGTILDTNGIRGTRSHNKESTREGTYTVGGQIVMNPTPIMLDLWLPRILGAAESTDTFALDEALPAFGVLIDRVAKTHEYTDCYVSRATFRGRAGGWVEMALDIVGTTEALGTAAPAVSIATDANNFPYTFTDGVLTLAGAGELMMDFELIIDNFLDPRHTNSTTVTSITPQDRLVTLRTTNPYTSAEEALYGAAANLTGIAGSVSLTNGNMSTLFTFGTLQLPDKSPIVGGKTEVPLILEMVARSSGATKELVITSDSTA